MKFIIRLASYVTQIQEKLITYRSTFKNMNEDLENLKQENITLKKDLKAIEEKNTKKDSDFQNCKTKLKSFKVENRELKSTNEEILNKFENTQNEFEMLNSKYDSFMFEKNEQEIALRFAKDKILQLQERLEKEEYQNNNLRKICDDNRQKYEGSQREYNLIMYKTQEREENFKNQYFRNYNSQDLEKENLKNSLIEKDKELNNYREEIREMNKKIENFKNDIRNIIRFAETKDFQTSALFEINSNEFKLQDLKNIFADFLREKNDLIKEKKKFSKVRQNLVDKMDHIQEKQEEIDNQAQYFNEDNDDLVFY